MKPFMSFRQILATAAVAGIAAFGTSAAQAQCRGYATRTATPYSYRSGYSTGVRPYSYRSFYQAAPGYVPSYEHAASPRGFGASIVDQQNAYRRSLGKPF